MIRSHHIPLPDRVDEAAARMADVMAAEIYGDGPDQRVEDLRRSILGDEYRPVPRLTGLAAWLP